MGVPDDLGLPSLSDLKQRTDSDVVRIWLANHGFVAVRRNLMDDLIKVAGDKCRAVYHANGDYYAKMGEMP